MKAGPHWLLVTLGLALSLSFVPGIRGTAASFVTQPAADSSAVINVVNSLRAAHGLAAYSVNSILMGTAQAQAVYMASMGTWSHSGPGGTSVTQRLLAAGYPLAGDLSLGGFRSENVVMGSDMQPAEAVAAWTGDSIHLHTMLSTDLQEIGAGVAEKDGMVYYVIDCARPTSSGLPQNAVPGSEAQYSAGLNDIIIPVKMSTPDADGKIVHEVQAGQSLWQIAIAYGVKIDDIRKLSQLSATYVINPGDKLFIKQVATPTAAPPTAVPLAATETQEPVMATAQENTASATIVSTETPEPTSAATASNAAGAAGAVGAIVVAALVIAGVVAWAARSRPI